MKNRDGVRSIGVAGTPERSGGGPATPTEPGGATLLGGATETEVLERPARRRFTGQYKLGILEEADRCQGAGELGALLRREGLYSSHLSAWRRQRREGTLAGLSPKKRGRKAGRKDPLAERVAELEKENEELRRALKQAETIIEVQKKLSEVLGLAPAEEEREEKS